MMSKRERLRWRIADLLNRLPWTAWCHLVDWAIEGDPERRAQQKADDPEGLWRLRDAFGSDYCRNRSRDFSGELTCYCGKFADGKVRPRQAAS